MFPNNSPPVSLISSKRIFFKFLLFIFFGVVFIFLYMQIFQVSALSSAFERSPPPTLEEVKANNTRDSVALVALNGLERCAALIAKQQQHSQPEQLTLDTLLLTLCKFTGLLSPSYSSYIAIGKILYVILFFSKPACQNIFKYQAVLSVPG